MNHVLAWDTHLKILFKKQALLLLGVTLLGSIFTSYLTVISLWIGAGILMIPALMAGYLFLKPKQDNPKKILGIFYLAMILKIILTLVLFTLALQWSKLNVGAVLVGFVTGQIAYWFCLRANPRVYKRI